MRTWVNRGALALAVALEATCGCSPREPLRTCSEAVELSDEEIERLRSLGYLR
jgi:hypothetical protein